MKIFSGRITGGMLSIVLSVFVSVTVAQKDGDVRLAGSEHTNEGRVELFHNNVWGTVCAKGWTRDEAMVVCNQLDLEDILDAKHLFGAGEGPILTGVRCHGREETLLNCHHDWDDRSCTHGDDVGVICHHGLYEPDGLETWEIALIIAGSFVACCVFVKVIDIIRSDGEEEEKGLEPFDIEYHGRGIRAPPARYYKEEEEGAGETKGVIEEAGHAEEVIAEKGQTNEVFEEGGDDRGTRDVGVDSSE